MAQKSKFEIYAEASLAIALLLALRALPWSPAYALARCAVKLMDLAIPKLRRVAYQNLSFAFPEWNDVRRRQVTDGVFRSLARLLLALSRFPAIHSSNVHNWIAYEGLEHYKAAKNKGKGVLVATAHLGNWELSAFTHALMTEPMHVMVRPLDNPVIDSIVEARRTLSGNRLIFKKDAARRVLKALRDNEAVGILLDQNSSLAEGVFVHFFGKLACANSSFVKLAHHSGAAVIPGYALWNEPTKRYILRWYPEIPMSGNVQADTQLLHSHLEQVIREYPDQWMWIHRRWKTRPQGQTPLY